MTLQGRRLADRYELLEVLGAGGMATVYRARDTRLGREVAIKVLLPSLAADPVLAERFEREARALAAVSHPAVVAVYDVGEEAGEPYFVMELVEGETLAERLGRQGRLAPSEALPILAAVIAGLGALHARGFIHRDVKPQNILLDAAPGGVVAARLADFGLARSGAQRDLTTPGTAIGTLAYLAPELLAGEPATPTADVYALGAVAYETLTGALPFPVESLAGLVAAQAEPPTPPSAIVPALGRELDDVILRALGPAVDRPDLGSFGVSLAQAYRAPVPPQEGPAADTAADAPTETARDRPGSPLVVHAPTASTRTVPIDPLQPRRRRSFPGWLAAGAATLVAGALVVALIAAMQPFDGRAPAGDGASVGPSSSETARPATEVPVVGPADDLQAALSAVEAAIAGAHGGPDGLRGNDARDLQDRLDEIRQRLAASELEGAREAADKLVEKVEKLREERLQGDPGQQLLEAAEALREVLESLADGDGDGDEG